VRRWMGRAVVGDFSGDAFIGLWGLAPTYSH